MAIRLLGRNYPEELKGELAERFTKYIQKISTENPEHIPIDFRGEKRLTPEVALQEISELNIQDSEQQQLLDDLKKYLHSHFR